MIAGRIDLARNHVEGRPDPLPSNSPSRPVSDGAIAYLC